MVEKNPNFERLCTKEKVPSAEDQAPLRCRYEKSHSPFYRIAPMKVEEVSQDPYIVIFKNMVSDAEIEQIKEFARPRVCSRIQMKKIASDNILIIIFHIASNIDDGLFQNCFQK